MKPLTSCPLCDGTTLETVATFRFARPERSAAELADGAAIDLRLAVMFEELLPAGQGEHEMRTVTCTRCSFVSFDPAWEAADISRKYARLGELLPPPARRDDLRGRARRIRKLVRRYQAAQRPLRIVDVGGSTGSTLVDFVAAGDVTSVIDIDPGELAPGVRLLGPSFADAGDERFDAVLCLHTLEHVTDPRAFLAGLVGLLAPGGVLYVEVPLGTLLECRELREPLTHVGFFCEESLHHALRAAGLRVLHASTDRQLVVTGPQWCVNMVGCRDDNGASVPPRPAATQEQILGVLGARGQALRHPLLTARALAARALKPR